jgi:hypothetical protein
MTRAQPVPDVRRLQRMIAKRLAPGIAMKVTRSFLVQTNPAVADLHARADLRCRRYHSSSDPRHRLMPTTIVRRASSKRLASDAVAARES